ncbi:MAG TPA: c-type cytochrome [Acetobacteraceae bacterium]|nr:c-type cytochrome [Acetobacteraceae bacterium]
MMSPGKRRRTGRCIWLLLGGVVLTGTAAPRSPAQTGSTQTGSTASIAEKAAVCSACHGANGVPISKEIPVIWGQHAGYIFLDLRDFQTGARKNELMEPIVKGLSRSDMLALGEYFEAKTWPDLGQPRASATDAAHAQAVAASGQCTQCHLGGFLGDSANPRLAAQSADYLRKTMRDFRTGARANNPWMTALLKTFSDGDIDAMAKYLGGL